MVIHATAEKKKITFQPPTVTAEVTAPPIEKATDSGGLVKKPTLDSRNTAREALRFDPTHQQTYASLHAIVPSQRGPTPVTSDAQATANGFTFSVGPAVRPDIQHDNGFLENGTRPPTEEDQALYDDWVRRAEIIQHYQGLPGPLQDVISGLAPEDYRQFVSDGQLRNIPDGIAAYKHFLHGNGADREFSYDKFVREDPAGQQILAEATSDLQLGAEQIYQQLIEEDPSLANQPITFSVTSSAIGSSHYPESENWQKAIGAHQIWLSANVTVTPGADGPQFAMDMTLHGEDRYNFNPGAADITTGTLDAENGRFEETGLAHQYMHYGELQRHVEW